MAQPQRFARRTFVAAGLTAGAAIAGVSGARHSTVGQGPGTPSLASPVAAILELAIEMVGVSFVPATIRIPANTPVRLVVTNHSAVFHDLVIPKLGRRIRRIGPDETAEILIRAEPGSYTFYCSIPSHTQAGMEGTITAAGYRVG